MVENIKRLIWLWIQCIKSMKNLTTLVPFLVYAIIQAFILYSLVNFVHSPFANILIPLIRKLFGELALHYPTFFHILTPLYSQINTVLSGVLGIIVVGMATHLFALNFRNRNTNIGQAFKITIPKYGSLFIVWIIESILTLIMIIGFPQLINILFQPGYYFSRIIGFAGLFLGITVTSIFAYTTVLIVLAQKKLFESISLTYLIFRKNMSTSLLLVAVPTLLYFPINYLSGKSVILITKFSPEIMATILGIGILISSFSSYFQIGTITRFYLLLIEKRKR